MQNRHYRAGRIKRTTPHPVVVFIENKMTIDQETRKAIRALTDYLHEDEQKHYEESNRESGHIFESVQTVENWLDETREPQPVPLANVENMTSPRGNREVPNQFIIYTEAGTYFKSYASIIAFKPRGGGKVVLDENKWNYSTTTGKYRNQFLGEGIEETRKKIASGEYVLADLNK